MTRVKTGIGVVLAAIATIGLGAGVAAADPQQPLLVDDPTSAVPSAGNAVGIANALFGQLSSLMNNVIPGSGDLLMPASSALSPGGLGGMPGHLQEESAGCRRSSGRNRGMPGGLPGEIPGGMPGGLPGEIPGGMPGGLPEECPACPAAIRVRSPDRTPAACLAIPAGYQARRPASPASTPDRHPAYPVRTRAKRPGYPVPRVR